MPHAATHSSNEHSSTEADMAISGNRFIIPDRNTSKPSSSSSRKNKGIQATVRGAGVKAPQKTSTPVAGTPRGVRPVPTSTPSSSRPAASNSGGSWNGGGGYSGGGSYGGGGAAPMAMAAAAPAMSETDWLGQDSVFQAAQAAYKNAFDLLAADVDSRRDTYDIDYNNSLRDLGWNTQGNEQWNWEDPLTASGRAHSNQLNDYASRGMLQGSAYADALENLIRSLNQQRDTMGSARDTFLSGLERERAAGQKTRDDNIRQAEVSALERFRNQFTSI